MFPTLALLQMVMQQAEVPERLAGDREFGSAFVYESQLLSRRLGTVLVQQLDQLQALPGAAAAERGWGSLMGPLFSIWHILGGPVAARWALIG